MTPIERLFSFNTRALALNLDGVTHEDSLVQRPNGNCINWLVRHVLRHRNYVLELLEAPTVWNAEAQSRYDRGSQPIHGDGPDVVRLEALTEGMARAWDAIQRDRRPRNPANANACVSCLPSTVYRLLSTVY